MGLPLYRAPVESDINDIKTKATRARSAIRRTRRSRIGDGPVPVPASASASASSQARWRRSRGTPPTAESQWTPWDNLEPTDPSPVPQTTQRSISNHNSQGPLSGARPPHPAIREVIGRNGPMNDEIVALFGERMARLYQGTSSRPAPLDATEGNGPAASSAPTDADPRSWILPSDRPMPTPPSHSTRPMARSTQLPSIRRGQSVRREAGRPSNPDVERLARGESERDRRPGYRVSRAMARLLHEQHQESRYDGLGDRDRSLSPEGDGVWDTLLSSITPDPQPPSVGSSFASTSASARASQSTASAATGSSNTSFSGPIADTAEESGVEHPCESAGENSDTEGDEEDETGDNTLTRFRPGPSYAAIVARTELRHDEDIASRLAGDYGGMQRIVRNLARREDIPAEWWAEVGLSRTLSREGSS